MTDTEEGDVPVQPPGVTSREFNQYVAVDDGLQTTADVTDAELCYDQQPAAADVAAEEESDGELSEATGTACNWRRSTTCCDIYDCIAKPVGRAIVS